MGRRLSLGLIIAALAAGVCYYLISLRSTAPELGVPLQTNPSPAIQQHPDEDRVTGSPATPGATPQSADQLGPEQLPVPKSTARRERNRMVQREQPSGTASNDTATPEPKPEDLPAAPPPPEIDSEAARDLDRLTLMFRDYRTRMGENPFGTNAEIMKAVMGENQARAIVGPPEGLQLNGKGELLDRWGTPYFFHQMSAKNMEIHSAGPDRMHGTNDDIIQR